MYEETQKGGQVEVGEADPVLRVCVWTAFMLPLTSKRECWSVCGTILPEPRWHIDIMFT